VSTPSEITYVTYVTAGCHCWLLIEPTGNREQIEPTSGCHEEIEPRRPEMESKTGYKIAPNYDWRDEIG